MTQPGGPYFDELVVGQVFDGAPSTTLTPGVAAVHQSIVGDRMRLPLDAELTHAVTGVSGTLAHPALVCDVAIGQSTVVTQRVKANLFYRGLRFHRFPMIGDTLFTRTEVVALRENSVQPGRAPTGLAALRMTTIDHIGRLVLDFHRCAMLPLSPAATSTGHVDDLSRIGTAPVSASPVSAAPVAAVDPIESWSAAAFRDRIPGPHFSHDMVGTVLRSGGDVVSSAPELARLTLNVAAVHHDETVGGRRLVYGGHTIGLALAQATRLLPNLATVLSWQSCDHTGPVAEGDTLHSEVRIEKADTLPGDRGAVLTLRSLVFAIDEHADDPRGRPVLDWLFTALHF